MPYKLYKITLILCIFLGVLFSKATAQEAYEEKSIDVALRMIGHQLLLHSNDSTSRVLPISKHNDAYNIQFESAFAFEPVQLVTTIDSVISAAAIASTYIVEVEHCETGEVIYSFKIDELEQSDIIPCGRRLQPKACYRLLFTFLETTAVDSNILPVASGKGTGYYGTLTILLLGITGLSFFLWKRWKASKVDPNLIPLGEYHFDKRNTELLINHQKIELTSKEADLLLLLYNTVNTTVEREVILNKVWGDQGDYVGRTLDVFISKLRKKLEADSSVKIANIRGVGYKLVMEV